MDTFPDILRVTEVSALTRMAPRTIQLWAECGKLKGFKLGKVWLFQRQDVETFLQVEMNRDPD